MVFKLAIVGRPNVGKSTIFNRLVGKRVALVDNQPGVTRDLREQQVKISGVKFLIVDTAGLENALPESLQQRMSDFSLQAVDSSDACVFVIDMRAGLTTSDQILCQTLRKSAKKIILVANKSEGKTAGNIDYDVFSLGLGEPLLISAEHGLGFDEFKEVIVNCADKNYTGLHEIATEQSTIQQLKSGEETGSSKRELIQLSFVGRPNSGKSTLINRILGEERLLTGPEAGVTRDAISIISKWGETKFRIFDTAGIRKKAKIKAKLEKMSVSDALRAIKFSEVVVLVIDASIPFESQDLRLVDLSEREGRCIVIAINKWDLEKKKVPRFNEIFEKLNHLLPQITGVQLHPVSGLTGEGLNGLNKKILKAYKIWNSRISTSRLNSWLLDRVSSHPPPTHKGKRLKLRYITQYKSRPPSFVIFVSVPDLLPESYKRYLINSLRRDFKMPGTPIRLIFRAGENPYKK